MTTLETMYSPQANSPATSLTGNISSSATSITVLDGSVLPTPPNLLVIGGDTANAETVLMTAKSGNTLTVTRGVQGTAKSWTSGATIARLFTAKDLADVQTNIANLDSGKAEKTDLNAANDRIDEVYANSASGSIATFERITSGIPVSELIADIDAVQAGSGDPSPSNVRAISGFSSIDIGHAGRNLLVDNRTYPHTSGSIQITRDTDGGYIINGSKSSDAAVVIFNFAYPDGNTTATQCDNKKWLPNGQYKMSIVGSGLPSGANASLQAFYNTKTDDTTTAAQLGSVSTNSSGATAITVSDAHPFVWFRLLFSSGAYTFDNVKLYPMIYRADETDTSWDAPRASKAISLGRTVYGGTLDVTTGLLTVTHGYATFNGSENWGGPDESGNIYLTLSVAGKMTDRASGELTSQLKFNLLGSGKAVGEGFVSSGGYLNCKLSGISTVAAWKTALSTNNLQCVYPLASAQTYQLPATQITSLLGENNIWADTGDVYVEFGDDIKAYVDAKAADKQDKITASGILKGDGTGGVSAAVAGTDYQAPLIAGTDYQTPLSEPSLQWYGVCSTSASTQAKTVSITGITALTEGLEIRVKMTNAQTYNGTPTLNVNSLGAKTIKQHGSTDAVRYQWQAGEVISFTYDGTYWVIENNSLATTTYFGLTRLNSATNSTAEDCAATPNAVKTAYDLAAAAVPATEKGTNVATLATAADSTTPSVPRITPAQSFAPIFSITADTTLAAKHAGGILKCTNSPTITIPSNVFSEATQIEILNYGTGVVTVQGASGCSLNGTSAGSKQITDQYSSGVLLAISASQWVIQGAIS